MENKTFSEYCKEIIQKEKENMKIIKLTLILEGETNVCNMKRIISYSLNAPN